MLSNILKFQTLSATFDFNQSQLVTHLVIGPDRFLALFTVVGVQFLVARDAVRVLVFDDVATGHQFFVAVVAGQMVLMIVLIHGFCVFSRKDQLKNRKQLLIGRKC